MKKLKSFFKAVGSLFKRFWHNWMLRYFPKMYKVFWILMLYNLCLIFLTPIIVKGALNIGLFPLNEDFLSTAALFMIYGVIYVIDVFVFFYLITYLLGAFIALNSKDRKKKS